MNFFPIFDGTNNYHWRKVFVDHYQKLHATDPVTYWGWYEFDTLIMSRKKVEFHVFGLNAGRRGDLLFKTEVNVPREMTKKPCQDYMTALAWEKLEQIEEIEREFRMREVRRGLVGRYREELK